MAVDVHICSEWEKYSVVAGYSADMGGLFRYAEDLPHFTALAETFGLTPKRMIRLHQAHTDKNLTVDGKNGGDGVIRDGTPEPYDGLISNENDLMLCVVTADCTPVFLYDPVCGVAGMLHSGRSGTMKDISGKAVLKMQQEFGSKPGDIRCILGPYLCARHHEVERKDIEGFFELFSESECERFLKNKGIKYYVDMGEAIRISLMKKGVLSENIVDHHICTYEEKALYSWRRDHLKDKRIISFIYKKSS